MNPKGQAEAKARRAPKALELKIAGGSYRQIGKHLARIIHEGAEFGDGAGDRRVKARLQG